MSDTYNIVLERNPRLRLRNLSQMIKGAESENAKHPENRGTAYALWSFTLGGIEYSVKYFKKEFTLKWKTEDGIEREQIIKVLEKPSNIPALKGVSVYYFLDSVTGKPCRDLWYIGSSFMSRLNFLHYYKTQRDSHTDRIIRGNPFRKYGKRLYRGRITPYGKRVIKYGAKEGAILEYICKRFPIVENYLE